MDRRIAFWKSAMFATVAVMIPAADWLVAAYSQKVFGEEVAYRRQYDRAYFYQYN